MCGLFYLEDAKNAAKQKATLPKKQENRPPKATDDKNSESGGTRGSGWSATTDGWSAGRD